MECAEINQNALILEYARLDTHYVLTIPVSKEGMKLVEQWENVVHIFFAQIIVVLNLWMSVRA